MTSIKPLGRKAYGSIGHLPNSRLGAGDHKVDAGQAKICCVQSRPGDKVIVQQKYDGSNCAVAKLGGEILPLIRAGYLAKESRWEQHRLFHQWAMDRAATFNAVLNEGDVLAGEWLAQAHGTRYRNLTDDDVFVAFDIMEGTRRLLYDDFMRRVRCGVCGDPQHHIATAEVVAMRPTQPEVAVQLADGSKAIEGVEGVVYRVERRGKVEFLAKYVQPGKQDGCYLPEISGQQAIWNWRPKQ